MLNNNPPPRWSTRLDFSRIQDSKKPYSYQMIKEVGRSVNNICGEYKNEPYLGKRYILIEPGETSYRKDRLPYDFLISTTNQQALKQKYERRPNASPIKKALITGFNIHPQYPGKSFGDYCGHALLIYYPLDNNSNSCSIWIFERMKQERKWLFDAWTENRLELSIPGITPREELPVIFNGFTNEVLIPNSRIYKMR